MYLESVFHLSAENRFIFSRSFQVIPEPDKSGAEIVAADLIPSPARFWLDLTSSGSTNLTRSSRGSETPRASPGVQPCFIKRRWPILELGNGVGGSDTVIDTDGAESCDEEGRGGLKGIGDVIGIPGASGPEAGRKKRRRAARST